MLAVKALLAPSLVAGASLAARRFGPWIGGVLAGLPLVTGPILLIYALAHGRGFAQHAAAATQLGLLSLTVFVVVYGRLAARAGWLTCMLCGWAAFALTTLALDGVRLSGGTALAIDCVTLGLGLALLPAAPAAHARSTPPSWDLPLRGGCALVLVLVLSTVSGSLGPHLSGLLAPFPVVATVMATFAHAQRGAAEGVGVLRGMLSGFVAFALFCFTLSVALRGTGIAAAFAFASGVALLGQILLITHSRGIFAWIGQQQ